MFAARKRANEKTNPSSPPIQYRAENQVSLKLSQSDSIVIRLLLVLAGLILGLFAIEILFRFTQPLFVSHVSRDDRPNWYYLPENSPDHGNHAYTKEKPANTFRIVVVGDSFTYGGKVQYDDTFSLRLERMLNLNSTAMRTEVLNWGFPGYSTVNETELVKKAVTQYHADLILLQVTLNDPEQHQYTVNQRFQKPASRTEATAAIFRHWRSLDFAIQRYNNMRMNYEYVEYHRELFDNPLTRNYFRDGVKGIVHFASRHHVPLLPVVFPLFSHALDRNYPFALLHEKVRSAFADFNSEAFDLLSSYEGMDPKRLQAIVVSDGHPNEIAHRIAAEAVYQELVRRNLIPDELVIRNRLKHRRKQTPKE